MTDGHLLDFPIWSALTTRQAGFGEGGALARRMRPEFGLFVAVRDRSPECLEAAAALIPPGTASGTLEPEAWPALPGTTATTRDLLQLVADAVVNAAPDAAIERLGPADAPAMLELATLTRPGPFFARTPELGRYVGVKRDGALVAMAGERLRMPGHVEVSAVCTHPDHRGRGHGRTLILEVSRGIIADGDRPFLHSYADNGPAIAMYERLGFRARRTMVHTLLERS